MNRKQKTLKAMVVGFVGLMLIALMGCGAAINKIMPCWIEKEAGLYADEEITSWLPWSTVFDSERILLKMNYVHNTTQILHDRFKMDDVRLHEKLFSLQTRHTEDAKELRDTVFDPTGPIGILLPTLLGGTLGAVLIPRPGDEKKKV